MLSPLLLSLLLLLLLSRRASSDASLVSELLEELADDGEDARYDPASGPEEPGVAPPGRRTQPPPPRSPVPGALGGRSSPGLSKKKSKASAVPAPAPAPSSPPPAGSPGSLEAELEQARGRAEQAKRRREQEQQQAKGLQEEERRGERRRRREEAWEREVKAMNGDAAKVARAKKRGDKKVIDKVLRAHKRQDLYAVLGIEPKWWQVWTLLLDNTRGVTAKQVKLAYRTMAKRIHPDKNRDARAEDAFDALQEAHEVLADGEAKRAYDRRRENARRNSRDDRLSVLVDSVVGAWGRTAGVVGKVSRVLGPLAPSAFVYSALVL